MNELRDRVVHEVRKVVIGQDGVVEVLLAAVTVGGHLLLEGVPGVAKTLVANAFARAIGVDFRRVICLRRARSTCARSPFRWSALAIPGPRSRRCNNGLACTSRGAHTSEAMPRPKRSTAPRFHSASPKPNAPRSGIRPPMTTPPAVGL